MTYKEILNLVPTAQAIQLIKKQKKKKFPRSAVETIVGLGLIKEEANIIGGM